MGRKKKYFTEEERKAARKKYNKQYYQDNKDEILERQKQYKKQYLKQYYQDNKDEILERNKQYYQDNKEYIKEYKKQYYQDNKEYIKEYKKEYKKQYNKTPMGRAVYLISGYQEKDKKYNRGECTLTAKWIIENIFSKPCHYCGETDWAKMGCDRIDNSLPHTPDNVVPCCYECNCKRGRRDYEEFMLEIG